MSEPRRSFARSLYWRIGFGFILFLGVTLGLQVGLFIWVAGQTEGGPGFVVGTTRDGRKGSLRFDDEAAAMWECRLACFIRVIRVIRSSNGWVIRAGV